jgi:hypothetical protein
MIFRPSTRKWALLAAGLLLLILIAGLWWSSTQRKQSIVTTVQLADGRRVELVGVTTGPEHRLRNPRIRDAIAHLIPPPLKKAFGPNFTSSFGFSSDTGIALWLMCYDPALQQYSSAWIDRVIAVDEHGCEFESSGSGGTSDGYHDATIIELPVFPRRQKSFTCRMIRTVNNKPTVLGEFILQNPLATSLVAQADWEAEKLPTTKTNLPLVVQLNGFRSGRVADFTLSGERDASTKWELDASRFEDPTGNRGSLLCPREKAWKWEGTFFRNQYGSFDTNEMWTLTNISFPPPGKIVPLQLTNHVSGMPVSLLYLAGAGSYIYTNESWSAVAPWTPGMSQGIGSMMRGTLSGKVSSITAGFAHPFIIAEHPHLNAEWTVMFRVRNGSEIQTLAGGASGVDGKWFYEFHSFTASLSWLTNTALTMDVIVQRGRKFEFLVSPAAVVGD